MADLFTFAVTETQLTEVEAGRLDELEAVIERGLKTFVDVGTALLEIRDGRLYRKDFDTFEDYCRERWGFKRSYAYELIDAASTMANLSGIPDTPKSVSQLRPLTVLEPAQQREAWQRAAETAPR